MGKGEDGTSSEGVRPTRECSTATASSGEFETLTWVEGWVPKGSGGVTCAILAGVSMLPRVARVVTGFGEVEGMRHQ